MKIVDFVNNINSFRPVSISISMPEAGSNNLLLTFDVKVSGSILVSAQGFSKTMEKDVAVSLDMSSFSGRICLGFVNRLGPAMILSTSTIPEFKVEIRYGESVMNRISNLALLVAKSLINSHLVYPNSVPVIYRLDAFGETKALSIPISVFTSCFLKIQSISINFPTSFIESYQYVSCHFMFNGQKSRTDSVPVMPETILNFTAKFPINIPYLPSDSMPLYVKIHAKKSKAGQSEVIEHFGVMIEFSNYLGILQVTHPLQNCPGGTFGMEYIFVSQDACKALLPSFKMDTDASHTASAKYMNGLSWSNLKMALQTLVTSASNNYPLENLATESFSPLVENEEENHDKSIIEHLRFYESQIVNILKYLSEHESEDSQDALFPIQDSLEAFRADIARMIDDYPNSSHTIEEIGCIIQSFVALVNQKISKIHATGDDTTAKELLEPVETGLKTLLTTEDSPKILSNPNNNMNDSFAGVRMPSPLKKDTYLHDNLVASAPNLNTLAAIANIEKMRPSEFLCYLGPKPVSLMLGDDSIIIEDLQSDSQSHENLSFKVVSLAESYGIELSLQAIESHQFAKRWLLSISNDRISIIPAANPAYFPYTCINFNRLLKVKVYESAKDKGNTSKASFIEIYYLQDEEQNVVEYLKFFTDSYDVGRIYDILQPVFLINNQSCCEIQWTSIEKIDLSGQTVSIFMNPVFESTGAWEAIKLTKFFGAQDIHDAYCDLKSRIHRRTRVFSPISSGSLSPVNSSVSSLTIVSEAMKSFASYHLFRQNVPLLGKEIHQSCLSSFGLLYKPDDVIEFPCSFIRKGINIGRIFITREFLCFSGKRNGVRTSKVPHSYYAY